MAKRPSKVNNNNNNRWESMKENFAKHQLVHKKLSDTRWSARHDAIRALAKGPVPTNESLNELAEDENQTVQTRHDADKTRCRQDTMQRQRLKN